MSILKIAYNVYLATDQSLAFSIREQLLKNILSLFPSDYFESKLYDTNEAGKGYRPGYVSFALKPLIWSNNDLIGGILVRGEYASVALKSNSPETGTPEYEAWTEGGGNELLEGGAAEIIQLTSGYYNKKSQGSFQMDEDLGEATFIINNMEEVEELEITNPDSVKRGIESITQSVLKSPPEAAISHRKKIKNNPYTSLRKFVEYMRAEGKKLITQKEIQLLADSTGQNFAKITDKLQSLGFSVQ